MDNQPPSLKIKNDGWVEVPEGGFVKLSPKLLEVADPDTPPKRLKVVFVVPPMYGFITTDTKG